MPTVNRRRWRRGSTFGDGPRGPLDRERRAVWKARLNMHRRARRISPLHEDIGVALLRRLGTDGRLDPSHSTLADDVGCSVRSVQRALERFKACGLVMWINRLVRSGLCVDQTSNGYRLVIGDPPAIPSAGQVGRGTPKRESSSLHRPALEATPREIKEAQQGLAAAAARYARQAAELLARKRSK